MCSGCIIQLLILFSGKKMRYEDVLKEIGEFGRYQKLQFFLLCVVSVTSSFHSMNMVFVGPTPKHHCRVSQETDVFLRDDPQNTYNLTYEEKRQLIWPVDKDGKIDKCSVYNQTEIDWTSGDFSTLIAQNRTKHDCKQGWTYSKEYYESTIVTEVIFTVHDIVHLLHCSNAVSG